MVRRGKGRVMDKEQFAGALKRMKKAELIGLLGSVFDQLGHDQREAMFGHLAPEPEPDEVDRDSLLVDIEAFRERSLKRAYYALFNMNSKNFRHVPRQTREWCDEMAGYLEDASRLTRRGDHEGAVACFDLLLDLLEQLDSGREIVFAEEMGSWMIPADEKVWIADYLTSLAETETPGGFAAKVAPLIKRDSRHSFAAGAYESAVRLASREQARQLDAELERLRIRTSRWPEPHRP
jgi:hypothetical protein